MELIMKTIKNTSLIFATLILSLQPFFGMAMNTAPEEIPEHRPAHLPLP